MPSNHDEFKPAWSRQEFGTIHLGDKRLTKRLIDVAEELSAYPQSSINALPVAIGQPQKQLIAYLITRRSQKRKF